MFYLTNIILLVVYTFLILNIRATFSILLFFFVRKYGNGSCVYKTKKFVSGLPHYLGPSCTSLGNSACVTIFCGITAWGKNF